MKTLRDSLYESLLDDFKDQAEDVKNSRLEEWIKANCTGQFKATKMKGGFRVLGEMNIKDTDKIPFTICSINGTLNIENCKELENLEGLFADSMKDCNMNLSISYCENFESLDGLPETITGNLTLVNLPKFKLQSDKHYKIDGNVYIMKCGRRPKESIVRTLLDPLGTVMCSEEDVEANLTESFSEPHLYAFDKYLKTNKLGSLKELLKFVKFEIDKVKPSDTHVYKPVTDKALTTARAILSGDQQGLILMVQDGEYIGCTTGQQTKYGIPVRFFIHSLKSITKDGREYFNDVRTDKDVQLKMAYLIDVMRGCDEIIIYDLGSYNVWTKKVERERSRYGMIRTEFKDEKDRATYYIELATINRDRYKKMVESVRVRKDSEFDKVDKAVKEVLDMQRALYQKVFKDPEITRNSIYEISDINDTIATGRSSIMYMFNEYTKRYADLSLKSSWDTTRDKSDMLRYKDLILELCQSVKAKMNKLGIK